MDCQDGGITRRDAWRSPTTSTPCIHSGEVGRRGVAFLLALDYNAMNPFVYRGEVHGGPQGCGYSPLLFSMIAP